MASTWCWTPSRCGRHRVVGQADAGDHRRAIRPQRHGRGTVVGPIGHAGRMTRWGVVAGGVPRGRGRRLRRRRRRGRCRRPTHRHDGTDGPPRPSPTDDGGPARWATVDDRGGGRRGLRRPADAAGQHQRHGQPTGVRGLGRSAGLHRARRRPRALRPESGAELTPTEGIDTGEEGTTERGGRRAGLRRPRRSWRSATRRSSSPTSSRPTTPSVWRSDDGDTWETARRRGVRVGHRHGQGHRRHRRPRGRLGGRRPGRRRATRPR